jgi:hypothetical protein
METEQQQPARKEGVLRHLFIAFGLALLAYIGFYSCDRHLRVGKGAWEVTFMSTNGAPAILVNQPQLGISNVMVVLEGEADPKRTNVVRFDVVQQPVPFGRIKFEDLTYLPGSVTFDLFGHEVELLPRTLIANKKEISWKSGSIQVLKPNEKVPDAPPKRRKSFFN